MNRRSKTAFFVVLLVGAGYFFGVVCRRFGQAYQWMLPPEGELIDVLLQLGLGMGLVAVAAGLMVALVRPVWVSFIGFALSGLAMLLGGQMHLVIGLLVLAYLLVAVIYTLLVARGLNERIWFSMRPLEERQALLLTAMLLVACGHLYLGYSSFIEREGFSVPDKFIALLARGMEKQLENAAQADLPREMGDQFRASVQENMRRYLEGMLKPFERFIPAVVTVSLFLFFESILRILAWIPTTILAAIFALLKATKVTRLVSKTMEVQRLIMD
jgi:hypothetical protein